MASSKKGQGKAYNSQARGIILNVMRYFEQEKNNRGPLINVNQVVQRVADACDISPRTVKNIRKEGKAADKTEAGETILVTPGKKRKKSKPVTGIDTFDADAIRRHVYAYFSRKQVPTIPKLLNSLKECNLFDGKKLHCLMF